MIEVKLPKTKGELIRSLTSAPIGRLKVDLIDGPSLPNEISRAASDWRRQGSQVVVVLLEVGGKR